MKHGPKVIAIKKAFHCAVFTAVKGFAINVTSYIFYCALYTSSGINQASIRGRSIRGRSLD